MIRFPCTCGQQYEMPDDKAGTSFQCTHCGLLVDVPVLSDLKNLAADGTYGLDETPIEQHETATLDEMMLAFSRDKVDVYGNEKDLRNTQDDYSGLGGPETLDLAGGDGDDDDHSEAAARARAPKYDPITGELIRPLDVREKHRPTEAEAAVPVARAMIAYARHRRGEQPFQASQIIPSMFQAQNLVVTLVIFLVHVFLQFMMFPVMIGMWLLAPAMMIVAGLILSHYAVVVNDIATEDKDELPRPLRDFSWHDDLWGPFVHFSTASFIAYGPLIALNWMPPNPVLLIAYTLSVLVWGTFIFPALFLTTTTSGHWINLAPDRVLRVIRNLGWKYLLCVILWAVALGGYMIGIAGTTFALAALFAMPGTMPGNPWLATAIAYPLLIVGIFIMHVFCWYLGLQYRTYQPAFGWALQSHYRSKPEPRAKQGFFVGPSRETPAARRARLAAAQPVPAVPVQPPQQPPPLP
jgi:hypothetical protein